MFTRESTTTGRRTRIRKRRIEEAEAAAVERDMERYLADILQWHPQNYTDHQEIVEKAGQNAHSFNRSFYEAMLIIWRHAMRTRERIENYKAA